MGKTGEVNPKKAGLASSARALVQYDVGRSVHALVPRLSASYGGDPNLGMRSRSAARSSGGAVRRRRPCRTVPFENLSARSGGLRDFRGQYAGSDFHVGHGRGGEVRGSYRTVGNIARSHRRLIRERPQGGELRIHGSEVGDYLVPFGGRKRRARGGRLYRLQRRVCGERGGYENRRDGRAESEQRSGEERVQVFLFHFHSGAGFECSMSFSNLRIREIYKESTNASSENCEFGRNP